MSERPGKDRPRRAKSSDAVTTDGALPELKLGLGRRVRVARHSLGMSIRDVASQAGVTPGFISQLENGKVLPSIGTLVGLASALKTNVSYFFDASPPLTQRVLTQETRVTYEPTPGVRDQILSLDSTKKLEVMRGEIDPGADSGDKLYSHGAETEFVLVLAGKLIVYLDKDEVQLNEGDALTFSGRLSHGYMNPSDSMTEVLWAMTPATY